MRPRRQPAIGYSPPELAPAITVFGRNLLRMVHGRGELHPEFLARLSLLGPVDFDGLPRSRRSVPPDGFGAAPDKATLKRLRAVANTPPERPVLGDTYFARNFTWLSAEFGLKDAEASVLLFALALDSSAALSRQVQALEVQRLEDLVATISALSLVPRTDVRAALAEDSTLRRSGLLSVEGPYGPGGLVSVDSRVLRALLDPELDRGRVLARFITKEAPAALRLEDYGSLASTLEAVVRLLSSWRAHRARGVNVLLYGPTGVGKTEAARLIAEQAKLSLFLAGGSAEPDESPSARARLASLSLGNLILVRGEAALLFDEFEDLVARPFHSVGGEDGPLSKLWLNRFLESNALPTIWTSNSLDFVDPALLRRFSLAVEFPPLTERQRRRTWEKVAGSLLPAARLDALAGEHELSPAEIAAAVRTATLPAPGQVDEGLLTASLEGAGRLRGTPPQKARRAGDTYRLEAVNATRDLVALSDRLVTWQPGADAGLTLCLYGRSGTGKSEYVHYLARRMDRPLIVRNVSDLQSKWVGDTEKQIASAFDAARREGAVLLFDEADTFLSDRRGATQSWERSQVNEFLQQLEACRGFVAVTTNLYQGLDPAVLRRFVFKVEFLPLRPEQRLALWRAHLATFLPAPLDDAGLRAVEGALRDLGELVPGDFGVVARRQRVLGGRAEAAELLLELAEEMNSRKHERARRIGFFETRVTGPGRADEGWGLANVSRE
jgi:SpoVK/Ycf46/Vps4 family AAA+-type ATPase